MGMCYFPISHRDRPVNEVTIWFLIRPYLIIPISDLPKHILVTEDQPEISECCRASTEEYSNQLQIFPNALGTFAKRLRNSQKVTRRMFYEISQRYINLTISYTYFLEQLTKTLKFLFFCSSAERNL